MRFALAAVLVAAALAAGCGSDGDGEVAPAPPPADTAPAVDTGVTDAGGTPAGGEADPAAWAEDVCGSVVAWQQDIETASTDLQGSLTDVSSIEDVRTQLTAFLATAVERTDELLSDVDHAGTPAIEGGEEVSTSLQQSLTQVRDTFEEARANSENLTTDDPEAFVAEAQELSSQIGTGISGAVQALEDVSTEPELAGAVSESSSCNELGAASQ